MKTLRAIVLNGVLVSIVEVESNDTNLIRDFFALREKVWVDKYHWESSSTQGEERDSYDEHSTYLVVVRNGVVLGGCRMIDGTKGSLPIAHLETEEAPEPDVFEISRFCLDAEVIADTERERVLDLLLVGIDFFLNIRGHARAYATIRATLFKKLVRNNWAVEAIGPMHRHNQHLFVPARYVVGVSSAVLAYELVA